MWKACWVFLQKLTGPFCSSSAKPTKPKRLDRRFISAHSLSPSQGKGLGGTSPAPMPPVSRNLNSSGSTVWSMFACTETDTPLNRRNGRKHGSEASDARRTTCSLCQADLPLSFPSCLTQTGTSLLLQLIADAANSGNGQEVDASRLAGLKGCQLSVWQWRYLDGDTEHEAEEELVLLKQAPAYVAVQGVGHILHKGADPASQNVRRRCLNHSTLGCRHESSSRLTSNHRPK